MTITDEMLAAYAEGKTSGSERDAIRQYLVDNPSELQSVMMMMDEDFDLDLDMSKSDRLKELHSILMMRNEDYDLDLDMNKGGDILNCASNNVSFCAKESSSVAAMPSDKMLKSMINATNIISQKKRKNFDSLLNDLLNDVEA